MGEGQPPEEVQAVIEELLRKGIAGSDYLVEAIAEWIESHPNPRPDILGVLSPMLLYLWHSDFGPEWMGRDLWIRAFRSVGFISDRNRPAPTRSLVVYRGSTKRDRLGMAWTTSRAVAEGHVRATIGNRGGPHRRISRARQVWRAVIPPAGILARIYERDEREVVVDPEQLRSVTLCTSDRAGNSLASRPLSKEPVPKDRL